MNKHIQILYPYINIYIDTTRVIKTEGVGIKEKGNTLV